MLEPVSVIVVEEMLHGRVVRYHERHDLQFAVRDAQDTKHLRRIVREKIAGHKLQIVSSNFVSAAKLKVLVKVPQETAAKLPGMVRRKTASGRMR